MRLAAGRLLAITVILGAAGCRTAEVNSIAHTRPPEVRPRASFDLDEFVAEHNENAARIQTIKASPSFTASQVDGSSGGASGYLALERPRNFNLIIKAHFRDLANIGSNDEKFWYWFSNDKDPSVYYCNYEDRSSTSLAITYQPDWILDAMGLNMISQAEASRVQMRPGPQEGTTLLTFPQKRDSGLPYTRVMIVGDRTRRMQQLKVLAEDGKTVIAQATIQKYMAVPLVKSRATASTAGAESSANCILPEKMTLEWKRERMVLGVQLAAKDVELNRLTPKESAGIFVEPEPRGAQRVNLAQLAPADGAQNTTDVRESMPIPETRKRGARSTPPSELRGDPATSRASTTKRVAAGTPKPAANGVVLMPILDLDVVEAPRPGPADSVPDGTALIEPPSTARE
ncbi:hypothetical protein OJF2_55480 [Aquisphaera giovannonii]|uniref:Lipoprotein n=1 Tax=Aquisphaera giovannonii TaxID=406548 RepID=A0A5B9W8X2_9BACT|nr:hypothetical protein [Aquisphaera giovannonii]QEH36963.1 hypothetical protein OJF2_55480 [Aquisphaera giovannonii]